MLKRTIEVRHDSHGRAVVHLVEEDGTRLKLDMVTSVQLHAHEPFVRLSMHVPISDMVIDLPAQTGELLKIVAKLERELFAQQAENRQLRDQLAETIVVAEPL